ncbi:PREDICTED: regulator of nonsense transcripts 3A [Ceratosolen solmsi marchali]|uniref:Regulator of nonsense transcripts 3A n=1 Tax=Ceratosolen solmsi marchali TaxID=326594 RepID=A0AAJ6YP44_9HYME|nr:PREDICTED: regulator of nonsense transcripts 3A [Ceratosolen solmsi marchali]
MTEETQQSTETSVTTQQTDQNITNVASESSKIKEGKKEKCRPMTKVVIRRLPPTMTQEQFLEQVSPLPEYNYMYFAKADMSLGQYAYSRAYIDFIDQQDIFGFREKFDNYVFVDVKGMEFAAVVEYAPFQRVPKKRVGKKKDLKCGTIESDSYYMTFLESLKNQEVDATNIQPKTEYSFQLSEHTPKRVTTTPLLDFLKQRKQEKQRLRDEKREEKRRRDLDRKRSKDEPMVSKVLKNIEDRERDKDREINRENKENKDDKERMLLKDMKNRNKKDDRYRDKLSRDRDIKLSTKNFRDRDDRIKERDIKQNKKLEDKKFYIKKDERESHLKDDRIYDKEEINYRDRKMEEKRGKSYEKMRQEKKRLAEIQKKQTIESAFKDFDESYGNADDNEGRDDEDMCMLNSLEKGDNEYKSKYKNRIAIDGAKNDDASTNNEESSEISRVSTTEIVLITEEADSYSSKDISDRKLEDVCERLTQSISEEDNDKDVVHERESEELVDKKSSAKCRITKRRSSLESGGENGTGVKVSGSSGSGGGSDADSRDHDGTCLRRHKSLDGGNENNLQKTEPGDKEKDKKDPRLERRIRNKDRPTMEIYRPGMGKFSKQRMEREKGNEERGTPSQSPTPSGNQITYKSNKPSGSEVRSMTFKRSVSRDIS